MMVSANNPVCYSKMITIGGVSQYIDVRGSNVKNPLLVFLHGGPGSSVSHVADQFQIELERNFLVVNWDQRGAGRSFSDKVSEKSMEIQQFVEDTKELINYILDKYDKDKIYLAGHSWGSILGLITASQYPHKIHAYIGIGQVTNMKEGEKVSHSFVYNVAQARGNTQAIKELEEIGLPPYNNLLDSLEIKMKWIHHFGGSSRKIDVFSVLLNNIPDVLSKQYFSGLNFSSKHLLPQIMNINFFKTIINLEVPAYFVMGKYDYQTPTELAKEYFEILNAPIKKFILFEESAHCPNYEEPGKFAEVMKMINKETCKV